MTTSAREQLALSLSTLKNVNHTISTMNLKVCNGGVEEGISFNQGSVLVDFIYHTNQAAGLTFSKVYGFTEIFEKGDIILRDYIKFERKLIGSDLSVLEALLTFTSHIEGKRIFMAGKQQKVFKN